MILVIVVGVYTYPPDRGTCLPDRDGHRPRTFRGTGRPGEPARKDSLAEFAEKVNQLIERFDDARTG